MNSNISFAQINIGRLIPNFSKFKTSILSRKPDIFGITETWLTRQNFNREINIDDYNFVRQDRGSNGGGIGIYIKKHISYTIIQTDKTIEQLWVKIRFFNQDYAFGVAYRPPNISYVDFFGEFENTLANLVPCFENILCMGDFNVDLLKVDNSDTRFVLRFLEGLGLYQLVDQPTRVTQNSATLIDYLITNNTDLISRVDVIHEGVSDHELVLSFLNIKKSRKEIVFKTVRDFRVFNYQHFYAELQAMPWNNIYLLGNVDEKVEFLCDNVNILLDRHAPYVTHRITKQYSPWLTGTLRVMKKDRDVALSRYKRFPSQEHWNNYKCLRNLVTATMRREKKAFFVQKCGQGDSRELWENLRLLNVGNTKRRSVELPDELRDSKKINDFFVNSIPNIQPDQEQVEFYNNNKLNDSNFEFACVEDIDVLNVIKSIKSKATGIDGINIKTITLCVPFLLPFITHIINHCIKNSIFPSMWKKAQVIPLAKNLNPTSLNEVRPISILPTFSKIFEKILDRQLQEFLDSEHIIPENQSGYKKGHSCSTALLSITDDIISATDRRLITVMLLLDYSKAFDTLNHQLLRSVFGYIGLSAEASGLLTNYLSGREQAVSLGGDMSHFLSINKGVPQGSVLGPKLFLIYTLRFPSSFLSLSPHNFADDTQGCISFELEESPQAVAAINYDLCRIAEFSKKHCLKLNNGKTVAIVFGNKPKRECFQNDYANQIALEGTPVEFRTEIKDLGLIIDQDLRFTTHISKCLQKSFLGLKSIFQNRHFLPKALKVTLCDSLVLSHFNFCDSLYNPCITAADSGRIQRMQNSCLRMIYGIRKYQPISHKLKDTKWLNMKNRRYLHSLTLFRRIIKRGSPPYLYNKIKFRTDIHNINLRHKNTITIPLHSTKFFQRSFSYNVANLFNKFVDKSNLSPNKFREYVLKTICN